MRNTLGIMIIKGLRIFPWIPIILVFCGNSSSNKYREIKTTQFSGLKPVALKTLPSCFVVIIFFLLQLSTEHTCVDFTLRRIFPVAKMSPYIPFKIADWYTPGNYASYAPWWDCVQLISGFTPELFLKNLVYLILDRSNSTLVFLPEVNAVTICEVCGSYQCPNCEHVSSPSSSGLVTKSLLWSIPGLALLFL